MSWSLALDGRFMRLEFANAMDDGDGVEVPVLSATAFYRLTTEGPLVGTWFDDRGAILTLCGRRTEDAFAVTWSGAGETGRTVYRPRSDGSMAVRDSVRTAGGWREFGSAELRKTERARRQAPSHD